MGTASSVARRSNRWTGLATLHLHLGHTPTGVVKRPYKFCGRQKTHQCDARVGHQTHVTVAREWTATWRRGASAYLERSLRSDRRGNVRDKFGIEQVEREDYLRLESRTSV